MRKAHRQALLIPIPQKPNRIFTPSISSGGLAGNKISVNAVKQISQISSSKSSGFKTGDPSPVPGLQPTY